MHQWEQLWRFLCEARTEPDLLWGWRDVIGPKLLPDILLSVVVVVVEKAVGNPLTRTTTDRTSTGIEVWGEEVYFWGGPHHYRHRVTSKCYPNHITSHCTTAENRTESWKNKFPSAHEMDLIKALVGYDSMSCLIRFLSRPVVSVTHMKGPSTLDMLVSAPDAAP